MIARVGCHLNGGVKGAFEHAQRIGLGRDAGGAGEGGPIQIWSRNPSAWKPAVHALDDVRRFRDQCVARDLAPVFVHGIYLMNFASADDTLWEKSSNALIDHLEVGAALGAQAVVLHPGSGGAQELEVALDRCAASIGRALHETEHVKGRPLVALETCAGAGRTLGRTFSELGALISRLDHHPDVAVMLDTAHLWGSGFDLATEAGLAAMVEEMLAAMAETRVIGVHANDSKVELGSHKDRHENIGQGMIGEAAFARMLSHPVLRKLPWVMEVPGYDGTGPDAQNLAVLRRLAQSALVAA